MTAAARGVHTIWWRELVILGRDWPRLAAAVGQPLFYLLILGTGISASVRLLDAPSGVDYLRFLYPGVIAMSVLFTSTFSSVSIIWDRKAGFLQEVLVAPVPRWSVALGKILGGASVATVQALLLLALAPVLGLSLTVGAVLGVLGIAFLVSVALSALGVALAARMESTEGFHMILNFMVMPLYFLSGAMFPIATAPGWMQPLLRANPLSYGVDGMRSLLLGDALAVWGPAVDAVVVAGFAMVLTLVAVRRFSRA